MNYAEYIDAFEAQLKSPIKMHMTASASKSPAIFAGGREPFVRSNRVSPKYQAMKDLHADGKNVEFMSEDTRFDNFCLELQDVCKKIPEQEINFISAELRDLTSGHSDKQIQKENFEEISNILSKQNASRFAKTLCLAVARIYLEREELIVMAEKLMG